MSKLSSSTVLDVAIVAGLAYLAFHPTAARDLSNWVRRQVGDAPSPTGTGTLNYAPVVPGK